MIRIQMYGAPEVRHRVGRIPEEIERAITAFAEHVFDLALAGASAHDQTGAMADSLGYGPYRVRSGWEIRHDLRRAPHAVFVHWGTQAHDITPNERKALRWPSGGGFRFAKRVWHPGYKGDAYLVTAAGQAARDFPTFAKAIKL